MPHTTIGILHRPYWPKGLEKCLSNILDTTKDLSDIEIIVKIGFDTDSESWNVIERFRDKLPIKEIILPTLEFTNRAGLLDYCNIIAMNSKGILCWILSDEVRILTKDWDVIAKKWATILNGVPWVLNPRLKERNLTSCAWYPIVTKRFIELQGGFAQHMLIDSYIDIVSGFMRNLLVDYCNSVGKRYDRIIERSYVVPIDITEDHISKNQNEVTKNQLSYIETRCSKWFVEKTQFKDINLPEVSGNPYSLLTDIRNEFKKVFDPSTILPVLECNA